MTVYIVIVAGILLLSVSARADNFDTEQDSNTSDSEDINQYTFGSAGFMYFDNPNAEIIHTATGTVITFSLNIDFDKADTDDNIESVWVSITGDFDGTWKHYSLDKKSVAEETKKKTKSLPKHIFGNGKEDSVAPHQKELWALTLNADELGYSDTKKFIYYFRAKTKAGNITTELPLSSPGWPPNPKAFFALTKNNVANSNDYISSLYIEETYMGFDGINIYTALKTKDNIAPTLPYFPGTKIVYGVNYINPAMTDISHNSLLLAGKYQLYAPVNYYNTPIFELFSYENSSAGRMADTCFNYRPYADTNYESTGIVGNTIYFRTQALKASDIKDKTLLVSFLTATNETGDSPPRPIFISPYSFVYFRQHELNSDGNSTVVAGDINEDELKKPELLIPGSYPYLDNLSPDITTSPDVLSLAKKQYDNWLNTFYHDDSLVSSVSTNLFFGKGPFNIKPCDTIVYNNYYFESYTRNNRLKLRMFKDGYSVHTLMIGKDTKPQRDEQHKYGILVTLRDFTYPASCVLEISN